MIHLFIYEQQKELLHRGSNHGTIYFWHCCQRGRRLPKRRMEKMSSKGDAIATEHILG